METQKKQQTLEEKIKPSIQLKVIDCAWIDKYLSGSAVAEIHLIAPVIIQQYPNCKDFNFSSDLYASSNFLYVYGNQKEFYNAYTKPGLGILFKLGKNGSVRGILLCMEEIEAAHQSILQMQQEQFPAYCLMTLNGDNYQRPPKQIQTEHRNKIQVILEQAQFVTGKINALLSVKNPRWLAINIEHKMLFLKEISNFVNVTEQDLNRLHNRFIKIHAYAYAWIKSSETPEKFLDGLQEKLSAITLTRISTVLMKLAIIRDNPQMDLNQELYEDLQLDDQYLIRNYFASHKWNALCSEKKIIEAVELFQKYGDCIDPVLIAKNEDSEKIFEFLNTTDGRSLLTSSNKDYIQFYIKFLCISKFQNTDPNLCERLSSLYRILDKECMNRLITNNPMELLLLNGADLSSIKELRITHKIAKNQLAVLLGNWSIMKSKIAFILQLSLPIENKTTLLLHLEEISHLLDFILQYTKSHIINLPAELMQLFLFKNDVELRRWSAGSDATDDRINIEYLLDQELDITKYKELFDNRSKMYKFIRETRNKLADLPNADEKNEPKYNSPH